MRTRRVAKAEAAKVAEALTKSAVRMSVSDLEIAKRQAALARKVALKYNVRFDYSLKRFTCHGCKRLMVPGANARVRIGSGEPMVVRITCLECGHVNRKIIRHA